MWLLRDLLKTASVDDMIRWTTEPALLPRCPIGKYRNLPWAEVPFDFLEWILYKAVDMRADILHCARVEMGRRAQVAQVQIPNDDYPF